MYATCCNFICDTTLIARFMGPTWGPSGADRTHVGTMLAPWTLLSGYTFHACHCHHFSEIQWHIYVQMNSITPSVTDSYHNTFKLLQRTHNTHPIARLWGQGMGDFEEFKICFMFACYMQYHVSNLYRTTIYLAQFVTLIARFMGPTWGPSGANRTQVGPMLDPWILLSGDIFHWCHHWASYKNTMLTQRYIEEKAW